MNELFNFHDTLDCCRTELVAGLVKSCAWHLGWLDDLCPEELTRPKINKRKK